MQIQLAEYDIDNVVDRILALLEKHNITIIKLHYFTLELDDEVTETFSPQQLKKKIRELYEEEQHFYFKAADIQWEYDTEYFRITFPEERAKEIQPFREDLL